VQQHRDELDRLGAVVAAVSFEPAARAAAYAQREGWPYPILSDPDRRAYAAFGLPRARPWQIWNWGMVGVYTRGLLHGRLPRLRRADFSQLGGDVVLAPDGRVVYLHRGRALADRPSIEEIMAAVRRARIPSS
jgi:peroxiredoxin